MLKEARPELPEASWFCAGLIPEQDSHDSLLVVRYWFDWNPAKPGVRPQLKFPGGSRQAGIDRTPEDTLARELNEEVFDSAGTLRSSLLHSETSRGRNGLLHAKHFFLIDEYRGELRKADLFEEERGTAEKPDGPRRTERVAAPEFIDIRTLAVEIFHRHAPALRAYCQKLAGNDRYSRHANDALALIDARLRPGRGGATPSAK